MGTVDTETLRTIRHDIKNQLSNIHLALDTMKHEVNDPSEDFDFCLDTVKQSAAKIDELLKPLD